MSEKFTFRLPARKVASGFLRRASIPVLLLFIFGFGAVYLITQFSPLPAELFDLNQEANLPAWYASTKWFIAALLFGAYAFGNLRADDAGTWPLILLPILLAALSADETAQIHERLGVRSDALLPGGSRTGFVFGRTGIWMGLIGIPFIVAFGFMLRSLRPFFHDSPAALAKLAFGMAVMLTGALGVETAYNFVTSGSLWETMQVFAEEMLEMLGATIIVWSGYDLALKHRLTLTIDRLSTAPARRLGAIEESSIAAD